MISPGDKLLCTTGNTFYSAGNTYVVGDIVNDKYFQLFTGYNDEHWYASLNHEKIYVSFNSATTVYNDAWFDKLNNKKSA
ncbi:hypothetical protein [uncultured Psychrobacter sp.]|uniref:hypothetical protein n=1 Tax=uncultured Psychrobacter sp. TaxID=259303 RepID=UPI00345A154B